MKKKFLKVAKFEYLKMVRKPSFWIATLFLPVFIAIVGFVSGYSSMDAVKKIENMETFGNIYIVDESGFLPNTLYIEPLIKVDSIDSVKDSIVSDSKNALVVFPEDFITNLKYKVYLSEEGDILRTANLPMVIDSVLKSSVMGNIQDDVTRVLLTGSISSESYSINKDGDITQEGFEKFVLPIVSLVAFFMAVFISSSFLLQSVSAEKENRMIETMLSIIDKKSLMIGKMVGLMGVVFTQLIIWCVFGLLSYYVIMNKFDIILPINISEIDFSSLPLNIFFIITGFLFFASVMTGVGAVGTGAEDSKNLSSVFIILSIFPIYLMQSLITDPSSLIARVFSYFPFTSFMVLLLRNSLGALTLSELIIGICTSVVYVVISVFVAFKLFELGCLMYNRRPTFKEILNYLR